MTDGDLRDFRAACGACDLVVLADVAAGTVLMSDSAIRLGQEQLDALCDMACRLFRETDIACDMALLADPLGSRVFLRAASDGSEVLCCRFGPLADLSEVEDAAARLLAAGDG